MHQVGFHYTEAYSSSNSINCFVCTYVHTAWSSQIRGRTCLSTSLRKACWLTDGQRSVYKYPHMAKAFSIRNSITYRHAVTINRQARKVNSPRAGIYDEMERKQPPHKMTKVLLTRTWIQVIRTSVLKVKVSTFCKVSCEAILFISICLARVTYAYTEDGHRY